VFKILCNETEFLRDIRPFFIEYEKQKILKSISLKIQNNIENSNILLNPKTLK